MSSGGLNLCLTACTLLEGASFIQLPADEYL